MFLFFALAERGLLAQPGILALSSGSTTQGGTVSLNLSFTSSGSQPAGLEWTIVYTASNIVSISATAGPAATAAGKSISCAGASGSYVCLASGINTNAIANGIVATVSVTLAPATTSTSLGLTNTLGATAGGDAYSVSGTGGTITASTTGLYHVSSLSCTPTTLQGAAYSTCTAGLDTAAPAGGATVLLSSDNANVTMAGSITVA